jgi:RNA polymerase sigma-70 factor (ECF subfamily)
MGNNEDAEDITQEVAIKIFRSLASCRGEEFLSAWISKITHNSCMDALRRRKGKYNESLDEIVDFGDGQMEKQLEDESDSPEELLLKKELSEQIEAALLRLPLLYRSPVVLRDMQGYSYDEMAEILNMPAGTVKSRLFRGRAKLKTILSETMPGGHKQSYCSPD